MSTVQIRDAKPQDAAVIAENNRALALEAEGRHIAPSVARAGVERGLARPDLCRYLVAEQAQEIVGQAMITFEWSDWRAGIYWWIQSVYVRPEQRGRGIFRALYDHIARQARTAPEVIGLRLYVDQGNTRAQAIYRHLGLDPVHYILYERLWTPTEDPG